MLHNRAENVDGRVLHAVFLHQISIVFQVQNAHLFQINCKYFSMRSFNWVFLPSLPKLEPIVLEAQQYKTRSQPKLE